MLYLNEEFRQAWKQQDPFAVVETLQGEVYRQLEARKTLRFELNGKGFFVKIHRGVGWLEIVENLIRLRMPVLGAENEWQAIAHLEQQGIGTMHTVAYGKRGSNPAAQQSFIVTEELANMVSLEDFCMGWDKSPPAFSLKRALVHKLADISRRMHQSGMNHRDYYLCHFLLDLSKGEPSADNLDLYLIDLHRSQLRKSTPKRWVIKDLSGLYFSALDIGLSDRDLLRFVRIYTGLPLKQALKQFDWLWQPLMKKAAKLQARTERKGSEIK